MKKKSFIIMVVVLCVILMFIGYFFILWGNDDEEDMQKKSFNSIEKKKIIQEKDENQVPLSKSSICSQQNSFDDSIVDEHRSNVFLYIVIIFLSISTLIAVGVSFYLYRWRKILLANSNLAIPEEWVKYLQMVDKNINNLSSFVDANLNRVFQESLQHTQLIENMIKTYIELQEVLNQKDKEITRLREGYDAEIFKKFIGRFVRVDQALDEFIAEGKKTEDFFLIKRLLEDAFEECGVEKICPRIGEDYRSANGVADNPKIEFTTDPAKDFQIVEIVGSGYILHTGVEPKVIIPAKVKINKYEEKV